MNLLISPTEHVACNICREHSIPHSISSLCETHGADFLTTTTRGIFAFQRKTLPDLKASLLDGRLYKELVQLQNSPIVQRSFLVLEFVRQRVTLDGQFLDADISVQTLNSVIAKIQVLGIHWLETTTAGETVDAILSVSRYLATDGAYVIRRPKGVADAWGRKTSAAYVDFLLQSFPGIGPKQAAAIREAFPRPPLAWTVTAKQLLSVPGIGKVTVKRLLDCLPSIHEE